MRSLHVHRTFSVRSADTVSRRCQRPFGKARGQGWLSRPSAYRGMAYAPHSGFTRIVRTTKVCVDMVVQTRLHYTQCSRLATSYQSVETCKVTCIRSHALLHFLSMQVSCRGEPHCILAWGLVDAFVFAANHHRHHRDDPGHIDNLFQGRIRLMTALAFAYAHALQMLCSGRRPGDILVRAWAEMITGLTGGVVLFLELMKSAIRFFCFFNSQKCIN